MKKVKEMKGITLIALVITIVILLILAGVSIATLTGDHGILTQAQKAKEVTKQATEQELRDLAQVEASLNVKKEITYYSDNSTGATVQVPIPQGFARTNIEGENTVEDGLVIIDENGNEYVWIPCTEAEYTTATDQKGTWDQWGYSDKTWDDTTVSDTISYTDRLSSVKKYGGFYVARYEAGIPEEATDIYANTDGANYNQTGRNTTDWTPVSKKGVQAWNCISQTNSKKVAQKMTFNDTVQSYLIDSYAWDIVCKKIDSKYGTAKNIRNSTTWGNCYDNNTANYEEINTLFAVHSNNSGWIYATNYQKGSVTGAPKNSGTNRLELATGASKDFKAYNIYDMAGNMWEWTTEQSTEPNGYAVLRGGSFDGLGSGNPVVSRSGNGGVEYYYVNIGFRSVLYLK